MHALSSSIPGGDAGTVATLSAMQRIVAQSFATIPVRSQAVAIVRYLAPRDYVGQAAALRAWMQAHFSFLRDPQGAELLHTPDVMLRDVATFGQFNGDCDDAAILAAALGRSVGFHARFVTVAFYQRSAPFAHVWTELQAPTGGPWIEMDITRTAQVIPWSSISRTLIRGL